MRSKVLKVMLLVSSFMLFSLGTSFAAPSSLTQSLLYTDTASTLQLHWDWDQGETTVATFFDGVYWDVNLSINPTPFPVIPTGLIDQATLDFQHMIGPDPDDVIPGDIFSTIAYAISGAGTLTMTGSWNHPTISGPPHTDNWEFSFNRGTGDIDLTVSHLGGGEPSPVPIPPSLLLFCSGLLGLFGLGRMKLFA